MPLSMDEEINKVSQYIVSEAERLVSSAAANMGTETTPFRKDLLVTQFLGLLLDQSPARKLTREEVVHSFNTFKETILQSYDQTFAAAEEYRKMRGTQRH